MKNKKSDVNAKNEFIKVLQSRGFEAEPKSSPADIKATQDGQTWYFEIKMTKRTDVYFGAATLTEWKQAMSDSEHFRFVVAKTNDDESEFEFMEYTPAEFIEFSTIPPFKIYFNIGFNGSHRSSRTAAKLTHENLSLMTECYDTLKGAKEKSADIHVSRRYEPLGCNSN